LEDAVSDWPSTPTALGAALICALLYPAHPARADTTTVYRCLDAHLNVVYTDEKCKDGQALEIRTGTPDAAAVARLDREREALDRSADERLKAERLAAAQRFVPIPVPSEPDGYPGDGAYYTYPVAGYGYGPPLNRRPPSRHPPSHHEHRRGGAPPPPYVVPRR
jgi:hypothetical protein